MDSTKIWSGHGLITKYLHVRCTQVYELWLYHANISIRLITLFLYMVAELSALQQIVNVMTGLNGLPAVIVECVVTTIYTCTGNFPHR